MMTMNKNSITSGQKDQVVDFVKSAARKAAEKVIGESELNKDQIQQVIESGDVLADAVAAVVEQKLRKLLKITKFPVRVNYGATVEDMVGRGKYDWSNNDITAGHFPTQRNGEADLVIELVHFNRNISTDAALRELDKMGYRPAELHELLTLGEKYPDLQREFPIIALGSVCWGSHDSRNCAYLNRNGSKRKLNLNWIDNDWNDSCRFAVVRKSLHFTPLFRRGFLLRFAGASHQACDRLQKVFLKAAYIFSRPRLLFPKLFAERI